MLEVIERAANDGMRIVVYEKRKDATKMRQKS
jgi:hypothetical protein